MSVIFVSFIFIIFMNNCIFKIQFDKKVEGKQWISKL